MCTFAALPRWTIATFILLWAMPRPAPAQLIPIRTVPVSQAHQFDLLPSHTLSMGGVSIAVADSLLDPFTNPAKAKRIGVPRFFGSPGTYRVSRDAGSGRDLPLGALAKAGPWFGAVSVGLQQIDPSQRVASQPVCTLCAEEGLDLSQNRRPQGNQYLFAAVGRDLSIAGISVGASIQWSELNAVDGVDLLYAGSAHIDQGGHSLDTRLGALKEWDGGASLEVLLLHNRFRMAHDVFYLDELDEGGQEIRLEENLDRTNTWGLHAEYERPLSGEGWRIGWLGTINYKNHPKIPNYEIMSIPRDPGNSTAYNLGIGVGRELDGASFGVDLIYEPIWSHTWADSETPVETAAGETIQPGGMTIENHFRMHNALLRIGVGDEVELGGPSTAMVLQGGLMLRNVRYRLEQQNHVELTDRGLSESWFEWTPTWGATLRRPTFEIRYRGQVTHGTGRPQVQTQRCTTCAVALEAGGTNLLVAPSGPLSIESVRVLSHQLSLSLPLR